MAALDSLGDESPNIMEAKDIVEDDEARANRDRYHWSEVDLGSPGGWLKEWMELNLDQQVLYEAEDYKVRLLNTYKDTGECLLHARKGKVFATYNLDLVVKWYAVHRLDGRVVGEARGRFRVAEFGSERVTPDGEAREGVDAATGDFSVEGDWDFKKPNISGQGADQMKEQNPALQEKENLDVSDAEKHLKEVVGRLATEPLRARLAELHRHLAKLAATRQAAQDKGQSCPVADPEKVPETSFDAKLRADRATQQMVKDIKASMRNPKFLPAVDAIKNRAVKNAELRCMSLSDDDVKLVVEALPPRGDDGGDAPLEILDLSYNEITDVGVQELMFALAAGKAPTLKTFNLRNTKLTDVGRRQLGGLKMIRKTLTVELDDASE